jgi:hypothetical protein
MSIAILVAADSACLTVAPSELPGTPRHRPEILVGTAQPPADQILVTWPQDITVDVEIDEPLTSAQWVALLDGNPVEQRGPQVVSGPGTASIDFQLPPPAPTSCHTVELRVAYQLSSSPPYTPDSLGSDSLTWFYLPSGVPNGCPSYDAGLDPSVGPIVDGQSP